MNEHLFNFIKDHSITLEGFPNAIRYELLDQNDELQEGYIEDFHQLEKVLNEAYWVNIAEARRKDFDDDPRQEKLFDI